MLEPRAPVLIEEVPEHRDEACDRSRVCVCEWIQRPDRIVGVEVADTGERVAELFGRVPVSIDEDAALAALDVIREDSLQEGRLADASHPDRVHVEGAVSALQSEAPDLPTRRGLSEVRCAHPLTVRGSGPRDEPHCSAFEDVSRPGISTLLSRRRACGKGGKVAIPTSPSWDFPRFPQAISRSCSPWYLEDPPGSARPEAERRPRGESSRPVITRRLRCEATPTARDHR